MSISDRVHLRIRVLATADLDDELALEADKIKNVAPERSLPSEFDAIESAVAQQEPKLSFGISRGPSHLPCVAALLRADKLMMRSMRSPPLVSSICAMLHRRAVVRTQPPAAEKKTV